MVTEAQEKSQDEIITVRELALRVKSHPQTIYSWVAQGRLPHLRIGNSIRFRWPAVLEVFEAGGVKAAMIDLPGLTSEGRE